MGDKIIVAKCDIDIKSIENKLSELRAQLNEDSLGGDFAKKLSKEVSALEIQLEKVKNAYPGAGATQRQIDTYNKKMESLRIAISAFGKGAIDSFDDSDDYIKKNIKSLQEYINKVAEANKELDKIKEGKNVPSADVVTRKGETQKKVKKMKDLAEQGDRAGVIATYQKYSQDQTKEINKLKKSKGENSDEVKQAIADREAIHAVEKAYIKMAESVVQADAKKKVAQNEETEAIQKARDVLTQSFGQIVQGAEGAENAVKDSQQQISNWSDETKRAEDASRTFDTIENKIKNLVSAGAVFGFLSRAVRNTIQDMLELDKQFNEIAIVSDYSTSEMWKSFDSVNRVAQQFGVETKNVLEVQNLYYHQGKSMAEVNKLTAQTLTLAKITGMDYADATSNLTAVLNAYNIAAEDAVRVTDTIAAMDTNAAISSEELMTALTKTASIAANAGMSLESTEIFLTKMIETTREAPENLGTALKTIIARFGEVKQEIDGEMVELADINRVDTALKSVGVSLLDSAGQIRDLDQVFMELSSKWDDLDRNTQRYIATISAGSRQQSRFIAMMEDYDRTLELVNISQNSAGLGAKQLAKSQESLESSINRLKSSFQELASTYVKAGWIKNIVEGINSLVNLFNKIPVIFQPVVAGLALYIIKFKILNPILTKYRIIQQGILQGDEAQVIAQKIVNAESQNFGATITQLLGTMKQYKNVLNEVENATNDYANSQNRAAAATNNVDNATQSSTNRGVPSPNAPPSNIPKTTKTPKTLTGVWKNGSKWGQAGEIVNKATTKVATAGLKETLKGGVKALGTGITGLFKSIIAPIKAVFTKIVSTLVGLIGTAGTAIVGAVAAIGVAIFAIWKKFFAASVDDTKKIEALTKAQDRYNKSLQEYNNLQKNAKRYTELKAKTFKTAEELEEEQSVAAALVEEYPHLLDYIDEEGNYHLKATEYINQEIEAKKRLMKQNAETYNSLRLSNAKQGIYADESTAAGATMSNLQSHYASLGDEGIKDLKKSLDKIGTLDGGSFKKFAEAYASGEKASFNHKDFSNLFAGQINESEFQLLVETFSETGDIKEALRTSQSYSEEQINDIVNVWTKLNQLSGGLYEQLLANIGKEVQNIYVQQADLFVNEELKEKGISQQGQKAIKDTYSRLAAEKRETNLYFESAREDLAIADITNSTVSGAVAGTTVGAATFNPALMLVGTIAGTVIGAVDSVTRNWEILTTDAATRAEEKTQEEMEIFEDNVEKYFSEGENVDKYNAYTEKLQSATLETIGTVLTETDLYDKDKDGNYITPEEIRLIVGELQNTTSQELTAFQDAIKEMKVEFTSGTSGTWKEEEWTILNKLNISEVKRFQEIFAQMGKESGVLFLKAYQTVAGKLTEKQKADFLSMDLTNIDSVIDIFSKLGDTFKEDKVLLGELIGAMGGVDAVLFSTIEEGAEKTQKRLESLTKQLESFRKLAAGEGSFEDFAKVLDQKFALGDFTDIKSVTDFIETNQTSWTNEGIKYLDNSGKTATDLALKTGAVEYQVAFETATELEELGDKRDRDQELQYQSALQTMLVSRKGMEAALYEEWKANQEGQVKALEKEIEQLNKKKEAYAELIDYVREYDYYQNLNREINELEYEKQSLEFEIEFTTNVEAAVQDTEEAINNLNNQIAANNAGARAAEKNMSIYRDSIEKNYSEYIDFDPSGTLMMNQEKMLDLQQRITNAKVAGNEETAAVLEAEKEAIEKTAKAYENSMKISQDYTKKLQSSFKELDNVLKNTYENYAKAEEKIYEIIKKNEDKQLEAVKKKYDAIKKENDDYIKSLKEMVQKERDIRNRKKSEEDIKKKEKRLALMKMDTSGIYAKDIQDLEAELQDDYQSLEDAEIDRQLSLLEEQAEKEAEVYDKDVEFFELSLEKKRESYSNYQKEVNQILMRGSDEATQWIIKNDETYASSTAARQKLLRDEYQKTMTQGVTAQKLIGRSLIEQVQRNLELCKARAGDFNFAVTEYAINTTASNERISGTLTTLTSDYKTMTGEVGNLKEAENKLEGAIKNVITKTNELETVRQQNYQPNIDRIDAEIKKWRELAKEIKNARTAEGDEEVGETFDPTGRTQRQFYTIDSTDSIAGFGEHYSSKSYSILDIMRAEKDGGYYVKVKDVGWICVGSIDKGKANIVYTNGAGVSATDWENFLNNKDALEDYTFKVNTHAKVYGFATGGLADYTGPAWLDGTPSKPEMVLNPTQTKSFIQLVDVLDFITSNSMKKIPEQSSKVKTEGDTYNFNIEVSQMTSDYDVDKLVNRIEEKIAKASKYRQVTQVTMKR